MTTITDSLIDAHAGDRLARKNAKVLAVAQALAGGNNTVIVTTGGIVGAMLAPDRGLATVPITMMVLGMWAGTLPVGAMARQFGRRTALQVGSVFGVLSGLISCVAVLYASFPLFLLGTFCGGLYAAAHQSYRFAAADTASDAFRPKAVSWVLAGGVFAGLLGPQIVIFTKDVWQPYLFAATYLAQSAAALLAAGVLVFVKIPRPAKAKRGEGGRPIGTFLRTPRFVVAVVCGVVSYAMMNMVMTSAPLAMIDCGHSVSLAALGLQWHVIAMYAPSFFTGALIIRFGTPVIITAGFGLMALSAVISILGISVAHFWTGLTLLGLGWNLSFVGATTMVTQCHRPNERNKVQAFNDFLVFGSMAVASFASGKILASVGWANLNEALFPALVVAVGMVIWLSLRDRAKPA